MATTIQCAGMHPPVRVTGKWMKLAIWYKRTPVLKHIDPFGIMMAILAIILAVIFPQGDCTCGDQIADQKLEVMGKQGNKEVQHYMQSRDNAILCASKRQELLKKLEREAK